jgi:Tfp pilus assembly protein PilV
VNLVELTVALLLLTLGLLGMAATADSAGRAVERARRMGQAVAQARVTLDSLRSRACRVAVSATGTGPGQSWSVRAGTSAIRYLADTVRLTGRGPTRQFTVEGVALCP